MWQVLLNRKKRLGMFAYYVTKGLDKFLPRHINAMTRKFVSQFMLIAEFILKELCSQL